MNYTIHINIGQTNVDSVVTLRDGDGDVITWFDIRSNKLGELYAVGELPVSWTESGPVEVTDSNIDLAVVLNEILGHYTDWIAGKENY